MRYLLTFLLLARVAFSQGFTFNDIPFVEAQNVSAPASVQFTNILYDQFSGDIAAPLDATRTAVPGPGALAEFSGPWIFGVGPRP